MLFNSTQFLVFFPIILAFYYTLKHKHRWILLLLASYYFYSCWNPKYTIILLFSTTVDYLVGLKMGSLSSKDKRRPYLILSILINLGLLTTFKYFNFFSDLYVSVLSVFDYSVRASPINLLLPVGISFYTFQSISYGVYVYKGELSPEKHFGKFAVYVSFFPQLVAGPIERAKDLLPQFSKENYFNATNIQVGIRLVLWGFFKKIVIADRISPLVDIVYNSPEKYSGLYLIFATYLFAFQIYCDFSGYSDIAIGTARMMGYNLMTNFNLPYFSESISEFWRKWHISLSSWFKEYLYIPLGGNQVLKWRWYYNLIITFVISGFWHGANWTFIIWGALHGVFMVLSLIVKPYTDRLTIPILKKLVVFHLVTFAWIFFRSTSFTNALSIIKGMCSIRNDFALKSLDISNRYFYISIFLLTTFVIMEYVMHKSKKDIWTIIPNKLIYKYTLNITLLLFLLLFGIWNSSSFIYFQF